MAASLPMDIILKEILPRLPAKSLIRFKCVCKIFQTLISSPEFVDHHLLQSLSSDANRLLIVKVRLGGFYSFDLESPSCADNLPFPESFNDDYRSVFFVGSCNGLLCIGRYYSSLIILNPSTRIYRCINHKFIDIGDSNYGFGYDYINDDYKIVRAAERYLWVYSLKANSWRLVDRTNSQGWFIKGIGALINNHLVHWKYQCSSHHRIRCFDLCNERWGDDVPLPESNLEVMDLGVLDGSLCLWTRNKEESFSVVWVMKEYGVKKSWVKLMGVSDSSVTRLLRACPLAYGKTSSKEVLLGRYNKRRLYWYNIGDKTSRDAHFYGTPIYSKAYVFKGSLVAIPGGQQLGESRKRRRMEDNPDF